MFILFLQEDSLLHSELDTANSSDLFPLRTRLLSSCGSWREGHFGYQHSFISGCVSSVSQQNSAAYFSCAAANSQISTLHFYYEYCQYSCNCYHHQLELSRTEDPQDASAYTQDLP